MSNKVIHIPNDDELQITLNINGSEHTFELVDIDAMVTNAMMQADKTPDQKEGAWISIFADMLFKDHNIKVSDGQALMIHNVSNMKLGTIQKKLSDLVVESGSTPPLQDN